MLLNPESLFYIMEKLMPPPQDSADGAESNTGKYPVFMPVAEKGEGLKLIADNLKAHGLNAVTYGLCKNIEDYKDAAKTIGGLRGLLNSPIEFAQISKHSFSLIYADIPEKDNGAFAYEIANLNAPEGIVIFAGDYESMNQWRFMEAINKTYNTVRQYEIPGGDANGDKLFVIIGVRNQEAKAKSWSDQFRSEPNKAKYLKALETYATIVPAEPPKRFATTMPNALEFVDSVATSGITSLRKWSELVRPPNLARRWKPLNNLSEGHITNMIAVGAFRYLPIEDIRGRHLISGYSGKIVSEPNVDKLPDGTVRTTYREQPVIYLNAYNLDTGAVQEYSSREPEAMQKFILNNLKALDADIKLRFSPEFSAPDHIHEYLEAASFFSSPGILAAASRMMLLDGSKALITEKIRNGDKVIGYKIEDAEGNKRDVYAGDWKHIYEHALPAQVTIAASIAHALKNVSKGAMIVGQMGSGKTLTSLLAIALARYSKLMMMNDKSPNHRHTIVVMSPGHVVSKWRDEIENCFRNFEFVGGKTLIVCPGKELRRVNHYTVASDTEIACEHCGKLKKIVQRSELRNGIDIEGKIELSGKRIKCDCGAMLVDYIKSPLADIDDAFNFKGLSVIVLAKDSAKLEADWWPVAWREENGVRKGSYVNKRYRKQGMIFDNNRVMCPRCGSLMVVPDGDGGWIDVTPEMLADGKDRSIKFVCGSTVSGKRRDEDGHVEMTDWIDPVSKEKYVMPLYSESTGRTANHCNTQMWSERRLGGGGTARTASADYIANQHAHEYDLIIDEVHQYKAGESIQGEKVQKLIVSGNYSIGLTGTPYGGKASSVFYMMHRLFPKFREMYQRDNLRAFQLKYGMMDKITTKEKNSPKLRKTTREGNGVNPAIVETFLPQTAFLTLNDLHIKLPPRTEFFHWLDIDLPMRREMAKLNAQRGMAIMAARGGGTSMLTCWMDAALDWPNAPDNKVTYIDPKVEALAEQMRLDGQVEEADALIKTNTETWCDAIEFTEEWPETNMVAQIADMCKENADNNERSTIYVAGQKYYSAKHPYTACKRRGLRPFILTTESDTNVTKYAEAGTFARCELEDRIDVMAQAVSDGFNVLIVNPEIVAEGVDLIAFNNVYTMGLTTWSVYKFAQSLGRFHRPGQEKHVKIHLFAYGKNPGKTQGENELQALSLRVMSDKVRSANVVTGDIGGALDALNETSGSLMGELKSHLMSGKMPTFDEKGNSSFTGAVEPMTPFEQSIQAYIEAFEDARLFGTEKPKIELPKRPAKIKAKPKKEIVVEAERLVEEFVQTNAEPVIPVETEEPVMSLQEWIAMLAAVKKTIKLHSVVYSDLAFDKRKLPQDSEDAVPF